ncbi:MAG: polysaccharide deacetylase family protein [Solirubrobacteraceae bacterium]
MAEVMVLCYHGVSETWDAREAVTPDELERQLAYLVRQGWRAATFGHALQDPPAARTVAITFDDALISVKRLAFPILTRLGLTATVFAPTEYVSSGERCTWDGLHRWAGTAQADELSPMSWGDLGELAESSWEIGSHTCTHPHLTELDDAALLRELEESREAAVERLGRPLETIAYPYGEVDDRVAEFAGRAGYTAGAALSSHLRELGRYRFPRTGIYRRDVTWRFLIKTAPATQRLRASRLWLG